MKFDYCLAIVTRSYCPTNISREFKMEELVEYHKYWWLNGRRCLLTLKAPITAAADDIFLLFFRENKTWCFRQRIHMKYQAIFSSKDKSKKMKVSSAAIFVWRFKGKSNIFETWCRCFIIKYFLNIDVIVLLSNILGTQTSLSCNHF